MDKQSLEQKFDEIYKNHLKKLERDAKNREYQKKHYELNADKICKKKREQRLRKKIERELAEKKQSKVKDNKSSTQDDEFESESSGFESE